MSEAADNASSTANAVAGVERPPPILRNRNFILLWCAYTISALGDHLSEMAILKMQNALQRDDSTRIMAIMTFAFFLPYFLFGPAMGWLADRLPRKSIMIFADLIRACLMASLVVAFPFLFRVLAGSSLQLPGIETQSMLYSPWVYAAPLLVVGFFAAMFSPSRTAMLPTIVRTDQIIRANGFMNAMGPIASIASFLLGAHLAERYGENPCFLADAGTFVCSALFVLFIIPPKRKHTTPVVATQSKRRLRDGFTYCRQHHRVIELLLFAVLFWTAATVVRSTVPAMVRDIFDGSLQDIANYNAAIGLGLLAGAFLIGALGESLKSQIVLSWSFVFSGLAILGLAAVVLLKSGFWTGAVLLFAACLFGSAILVSVNALLQKIVPDYVRGRVFGVMDVVTVGGVLLATGGLGIPHWPGIDRFVPLILILVGLMLFIAGFWITTVRLRRGRFGAALEFWRNLSEFHNRLFARVRRDGICTIPAEGPVIVAANHNCSLDPFLLISTSPNRYPSFMIAQEFAKIPFFARLVRLIDCIPVNRTGVDTASVKAALRHLKSGRILGIFPQGRIQRRDEPQEIQQGVGLLALISGAIVIPAHISGTRYSENVVAPFLRRHNATVRYGRPVDLSPWAGREHDREAHREVSEFIMAQINALALSREGE